MNLVKNSKCLLQKSTWLLTVSEKISQSKALTYKKPQPPATKKRRHLEEVRTKEGLPTRGDKTTKEIFGATILPQNLSFENAKKLSENQVRLEDIPLVDENEAAELLVAEKIKGKAEPPKPTKELEKSKKQILNDDDLGVIIIQTDLMKRPRELKKSLAELFWAADPYEDIPGPKIFRSFINSLKSVTNQLTIVSLFRYLKTNALAPFKAYGPIVKVPEILGGKIVLISRPEHIFAVFEQDQRYSINSTLDSIQRSRLQRKRRKNRELYHLNEEEWETLRKSLSEQEPLIKEPERYFDEMDEAAGKFVRRIRHIRNRQNEVPPDFLFEISKWSLECLSFVVFDSSLGLLDDDGISWPSKGSELLYSLTIATKNVCKLETGFQFWRFMNTFSLSSLGRACDTLESLISEHVSQVQLTLIKMKENDNLGKMTGMSLIEGLLLQESLTPDDIVSNVMDTLIIGMNTMSTALGFLLYHLSKNPQIQQELLEELKKILPEKYSRLEYEQLRSLRYLQACLKESLRLKMPMPLLTRVLSNNVTLNNYQIPKGTFVIMTSQVEGMKEENFEDPAEFSPERWLDQDSNHPFASIPMRNCFEDTFERRIAETSLLVCVSQIVRQFSIEYLYGEIEATNTTISFPNKPLKFTFVERKE